MVDSVSVHEFGRARGHGFLLPARFDQWLKTLPEGSIFHLHTTYKPINYALMKILRRYSIPYVFTPHNPYKGLVLSRRGIKKRIYVALIERQVIRHAAVVHALTRQEVDTLMQLGARKVTVVPNTIDEPEGRLTSDWERLDVPTICFVGRLEPVQKGIDLMLDALMILREIHHIPARFTLIGSGNDRDTAFIRHKCSELGLPIGDAVIFAGTLLGEDKYCALRRSTIYLQLSRWEGFGISVLEALAVGTPVVISTHIPVELKTKGGSGGYIARDATEAARVMKDIFKSGRDNYSKLCQDARSAYQLNYSPEVVRVQLENMYDQIRR